MAIFAFYFFFFLMGSQQREVGLGMVEFIRIHHHDPGTTPFMVGMAVTAFVFAELAMESFMIKDIRPHFFVAIHAQFVLCLLVEPDVALLAVGFELGVPLDHLAGHQYGLPLGPGQTGTRQGDGQKNKA